ncbi:MAG: ATP-dependent DNA helicase RecG [Flavobacteriales bacterium]|nr:ATP-dependent DNA helicase RecG [Flavobacteriales bacterium]
MTGQTPFLDTSIEFLKGIGPERAKLLRSELHIRTYGDLLHHFPFRYVDRTQFVTVADVRSEEMDVQLRGRIMSVQLVGAKGKGQRLVAQFNDGSGAMDLVWFKGIQWVMPKLTIGREYVIYGKPSKFKSSYNMVHPELDTIEAQQNKVSATMVPVYPTSVKAAEKGMDSKGISRVMQLLVSQMNNHVPETLSTDFRTQYGLMGREHAFIHVHFPKGPNELRHAIFRLKFDELFFIQLKLLKLKLINQKKFQGAVFAEVGEMIHRFYNDCLPFELTGAQKRVIKEIRRDLGSGIQMNRLVQGDVGSGKTIVALMSMLLAIDNGFQAALMAPTEILAEQHFRSIRTLVEPLDINIRLLTGSTKTAQRNIIHEELMSGALQVLIGTHALIEDVVQFKQLGLVVVDEQHRFGVQQRAKLWLKGSDAQKVPHFLIMTATPIPRTLAMTVYGDLDTSVIDELPPGRKPIKTLHRFDSARIKVFDFMRDEIAKGRQIYVVYPLIDESEKMDYKDLNDGYESIVREFPLPQFQVSILHGRMKAEDKEFEMQRFKKGITHIMVSTTVIEVGVDVPNASVMVIESAERFGLSQLHQLRGRVGRGAEQSFCILMTGYALSQEARTRMETMVRTNDGFEIAEVDMKLRGPGDIQGTQQSGTPVFRISNLAKDGDILQLARNAAIALLQDDPELEKRDNYPTRIHLLSEMKDRPNWARVS